MKTLIPEFHDVVSRQKWLAENNKLVCAMKKASIKQADGVGYGGLFLVNNDGKLLQVKLAEDGTLDKELLKAVITDETTRIKVRSVINTTRLFDSHGDVHIDQLWNKDLKDSGGKSNLVNQHRFDFENILCDEAKAFTKRYTWKELGWHYEGDTQGLVFDSIIDKTDGAACAFMFGKYINGKVKEHSVGMRYVNLFLCLNNPNYKEYKDNWDKYYDVVANKDDVDEAGYFYAVTQAKVIEGSPVVKGSNFVTPTQSVEAVNSTSKDNNSATGETIATGKETKLININLF